MTFEVDDSTWPVVQARWLGAPSDGELTSALARLDALLARDEPFGMLIDSRGGGGFSPEQRALVLGHMKANAGRTAKLLIQAVVIDNLIQRTLYYAVNLVYPNPFPSKVFAETESARLWLLSELAARTKAR